MPPIDASEALAILAKDSTASSNGFLLKMKSFCALTLQALLVCVCSFGQTPAFNTGQAAHLVIGQKNFTGGDFGASNTLLGAPSGIAYANGVLWVVDANRLGSTPNNNRILRFTDVNSYPSLTDLPDILGSTCGACRGAASLVLGQPDFTTTSPNLSANGLRGPTGIATDGKVLAVADTDNNRVLIWLNPPTTNGQPADVVVGQSDFVHNTAFANPSQTSLRAPSGVWIFNGKLYIADTLANRILIYNKIPTSNNAPADVVLGQTSFTAFVQPDLTQQQLQATPTNMQTPVAVTTDGTRLFVADLAQSRVLMWNTIPTTNGAPADIAIGQPNLTTAGDNSSFKINDTTALDADGNPTNVTPVLCQSNGSDATTGTALFPTRCAATLSFPRFPFSDGKRLFIADGGNDRVLIFNTFPTSSGARADIILGQPDEFSDNTGDNPDGTNAFETPTSVTYDGTNLYVSDTYNRRVLVHTPGFATIPLSGVRNAASLAIYALGAITFSGTITANDKITVTVNTATYVHTMVSTDTVTTVLTDLTNQINTKDTNVTASLNLPASSIVLTAKLPGADGGNILIACTESANATFQGTASGPTLNIYLENPTSIAPGTLIQVTGINLCDTTAAADLSQSHLPFVLNGCTLYVDGIKAPLLYVSPNQVNAQMPYEFTDRTSISLYMRNAHASGLVTASTPIATTIVPQNPGLFAQGGDDPRPGIVYHGSSVAFDIADINGLPQVGDTATLTIGDTAVPYTTGTVSATANSTAVTGTGTNWTTDFNGAQITINGTVEVIATVNSATSITLVNVFTGTTGSALTYSILHGPGIYSYTEVANDTMTSVRDGLVKAINAGADPHVYAVAGNEYDRLILYATTPGPLGEGTTVTATSSTISANTAGAQVTVSVYNPATCCSEPAGLPVTLDNPAIPGESLYTFATGLGPPNPSNLDSGFIYRGGNNNPPAVFVDSILVQGLTAPPMNVTLTPNSVGVWYVQFQLSSSATTDPAAQMTIAQQLFVSNVVTFPILVPGDSFSRLPPKLVSATPSTGPIAGGNTIVLSGSNLGSTSSVLFGTTPATSYFVNDPTSVSVVAPAGTIGVVNIVLSTPDGSATLTYTYTN
jgi:uncharacterized protein (TIGR03437 family)